MSDQINDDFDDETDDAPAAEEPKQKPNWRRQLEADAEEGRKAKAEVASARRELALLKAGIDPDSKQGKLFAKAYDGDPTVEAVRKAAEEYGLLEPDAPEVPAEELDAHDRIASAAASRENSSDFDLAQSELDQATTESEVLALLRKHNIAIEAKQPGKQWLRPESMGWQPVNQ